MKLKISILFISILVAGCKVDQYAIEKRYWNAQRRAAKIFKNPHTSPPKEVERTVNMLNSFIQKYPQGKLAIDAEFNIVRLYIAKESYEKARTQLKTILNKYNKLDNVCAEALFLMGNSYQIEDNWNLALLQYKKIMQEYPITLRGMDIPIYIAQYYKIKYQPDNMITALKEAISYYRAVADKYPNSPAVAYNAHRLIVQCYISLKDWQNVINTFNLIIEKYKHNFDMDSVLLEMALIYKKELQDKTKAEETLKKLIHDYPGSRLIKIAQDLLKEMDKR